MQFRFSLNQTTSLKLAAVLVYQIPRADATILAIPKKLKKVDYQISEENCCSSHYAQRTKMFHQCNSSKTSIITAKNSRQEKMHKILCLGKNDLFHRSKYFCAQRQLCLRPDYTETIIWFNCSSFPSRIFSKYDAKWLVICQNETTALLRAGKWLFFFSTRR